MRENHRSEFPWRNCKDILLARVCHTQQSRGVLHERSLHNRALFYLLLATLLWALSFPLVKILFIEQRSLLAHATSPFLSSLLMVSRFGFAALLVLPVLLGKKQNPNTSEWHQGLLLALYGGLGMWLQADALDYTKASTCAFITQCYCVFLPLIHAIKTRRMPSNSTLIAVVMVTIGMAWLSGVSYRDLRLGRGEIETLLATIFFTMQILCLENPRYTSNRSLPVTFVMFLGIALLGTPHMLYSANSLSDCFTAIASPAAFGIIAGMAIFCSIGAYGLMNHWQSFVHSVEAGMIYCAEPVFTFLIAMFLPALLGKLMGHEIANETWTIAILGGGFLITAANIILQRQSPAGTAAHHPLD